MNEVIAIKAVKALISLVNVEKLDLLPVFKVFSDDNPNYTKKVRNGEDDYDQSEDFVSFDCF
jgi:hypothetical protein